MSADVTDGLSTLRVIRLVARRELAERLRAKSFYILTGILVLIILAIGVGARLAGDDEPGPIEVGVAGLAPEAQGRLEPALAAVAGSLGRDAEVFRFDDAGAAREALRDGEVDAVVDAAAAEVLFDGEIDDELVAVVQQGWNVVTVESNLADAGLEPADVEAALAVQALEPVSLDGEDDDDGLAVLTGTLAAILLFISLQTFGGYVLAGVVEEKSTAVIELLLARVRADQLLAGKLVGIGIAALIQFAAAVAASLASLAISGTEVPSDIWSAVPMTLVWFLTGYALYSMLFALAGSLVSRQEDAQAASAPILTALVGAYMLVFVFGNVAESTASRIMSVIPPIAPLLMPMRMAAGAASVLEVVVAVVLLLASIYGSWKLTGRIYSEVLLRRGSRISWRDAFAIARGSGN